MSTDMFDDGDFLNDTLHSFVFSLPEDTAW